MNQRSFRAAPNNCRCQFDIKLRDGSGAQCMRYRKRGEYCLQHYEINKQLNLTLLGALLVVSSQTK